MHSTFHTQIELEIRFAPPKGPNKPIYCGGGPNTNKTKDHLRKDRNCSDFFLIVLNDHRIIDETTQLDGI